ncbi:MAG: Ig-like domain repeat protein [Acidobacteriota bacterium]|nr:Ig-like domain repeat protein [Acidobacteriota bacterium]
MLRARRWRGCAAFLLAIAPLACPGQQTPVTTGVTLYITSPLTLPYGQPVDGYAQVVTAAITNLSGTITFYDGSTVLCVLPIAPSASCPANVGSGFAVGTHVLSAAYSGDSGHQPSTSNTVTVTVVPDVTSVTLSSSANPVPAGQPVTLAAGVSANGGPVGAGTVSFADGSSVLGIASLGADGTAAMTLSNLAPGTHTILATYAPTPQFAGSTSAPLVQVVQPAPSTPGPTAGYSISAAATSVVPGDAVSIPVTVTAQGGFNEAVQLSCGPLPDGVTCHFAGATLPPGGGTTTLQLSTLAPGPCGANVSYTGTLAAGTGKWLPALLTALTVLLMVRRRRMLPLLAAALCLALSGLSGCGACTDLGTRPGSYTVTLQGVSTGPAARQVTTRLPLTVAY